mgnify:CR=1 FL=1
MAKPTQADKELFIVQVTACLGMSVKEQEDLLVAAAVGLAFTQELHPTDIAAVLHDVFADEDFDWEELRDIIDNLKEKLGDLA